MQHSTLIERLEEANRRRFGRSRLKDRIHHDPTWRLLTAVLRGDTPEEPLARGFRVDELLRSVRSIGRSRARRILADAGVNIYATGYERLRLGDLTAERRHRIADEVEAAHERRSKEWLEAASRRPRVSNRPIPADIAAELDQ